MTLHHPHGQIYAYPYVPTRTREILREAQAHHDRTGRLLGRDILDAERADGSRVVRSPAGTGRPTCRTPRAGRSRCTSPRTATCPTSWPSTTPNATSWPWSTSTCSAASTATTSRPTAARCPLPYIAAWHQAPVRTGRDVSRLHLQVMSVLRAPGTLKYLAGSESGVGGWVNDARPEAIAARLRELG